VYKIQPIREAYAESRKSEKSHWSGSDSDIKIEEERADKAEIRSVNSGYSAIKRSVLRLSNSKVFSSGFVY